MCVYYILSFDAIELVVVLFRKKEKIWRVMKTSH